MGLLTISARTVGRRKPLVPDWQIPWPPEENGDGGESLTLRELIARIVREEVCAFKERQEARKFVRVLTEKEMEAGLEKGRLILAGVKRIRRWMRRRQWEPLWRRLRMGCIWCFWMRKNSAIWTGRFFCDRTVNLLSCA